MQDLATVDWPRRDQFALISYEAMLIGNLFGRLEVAMQLEGFTLKDWSALPPKKAIEEFQKKSGKIITRAQFDKLKGKLRARAFTVAYLQHDYQLAKTKQILDAGLANGTAKGAVIKELKKNFNRWGVTRTSMHHLETVHDTNVLGAYQAGRYEQQSSPRMLKRRPYWQYSTAGDRRVRPTHQEMEGKIYPASSPIWATWYPPNGFRCRCTVWPLSAKEAKELGVDRVLPKRKGKKVAPDKGFNAHPGKAIKPIKMTPKVLPKVKVPPTIAAPPVKDTKDAALLPWGPLSKPIPGMHVRNVKLTKLDGQWIDHKLRFDLNLKRIFDPNTLTAAEFRAWEKGLKETSKNIDHLLDKVNGEISKLPRVQGRLRYTAKSKRLQQLQRALRNAAWRSEQQSGVLSDLKGLWFKTKKSPHWDGKSAKAIKDHYGATLLNALKEQSVSFRYVPDALYPAVNSNGAAGLYFSKGSAGFHSQFRAFGLPSGNSPIATCAQSYAEGTGARFGMGVANHVEIHEVGHAIDMTLTKEGLTKFMKHQLRPFRQTPISRFGSRPDGKEYISRYAATGGQLEPAAEILTRFKQTDIAESAPLATQVAKKIFGGAEVNKEALFKLRSYADDLIDGTYLKLFFGVW